MHILNTREPKTLKILKKLLQDVLRSKINSYICSVVG